MISIRTNVASLNAQRHLNSTQNRLEGNFGRLSTGLRINLASDDAAGLGISENLKAQIRSLAQAERNANDGVSLLQTAEGAMNETSGILIRMRELAVQSANGTLGATERQFLHDELSTLRDELDRISAVTTFNGAALLSGGAAGTAFNFQVGIGATANDMLSVTIAGMASADLGGGATGLNVIDLTTEANARAALAIIDQGIRDVASGRADIGAAQNRLVVTNANLSSARENLSAANSRIRDVDVASETAEMTKNNILMQSGAAVLGQANQLPSIALSLLQQG